MSAISRVHYLLRCLLWVRPTSYSIHAEYFYMELNQLEHKTDNTSQSGEIKTLKMLFLLLLHFFIK